MFFFTSSNLWALSFFFTFTYLIFLISILLYFMPNFMDNYSNIKNKTKFYFISNYECFYLLTAPILCILLTINIWSSTYISSWFGHIVYTSFQFKMFNLILLTFWLILYLYSSVTYLSSKEIYDFLITIFNFLYWIVLLFFTNSLFTTIFVIEVLSTLIFLLIITSMYSSNFFYKNLEFTSHSFFENTSPNVLIQSILFFFWVSLLSSLNLFLFIIFLYDKLYSLDWYLIEYIFDYFININSFKEIYSLGLIWFIIIFSVFLKCGIAPFYVWKPTFFKGLTFSSLLFYITFFYFYLFLYFIYFLTSYFHELFFFYSFISLTIILIGMTTLFFILCETFFIKTFLAVSSILNSLLVLLAISSKHSFDIFFYI